MKSWLILGSINISMRVMTSAYPEIAPVGVATFFLDWPFFGLESFDRLIFFAS